MRLAVIWIARDLQNFTNVIMVNHLEAGKMLHQALKDGVDCFRALSEELGYSPFEAHDLERVFKVFAKVSEQEHYALDSIMKQASQVRFVKLSLIAKAIDKDPSSWRYWLEMAENLPLQDLRGPVQQALQQIL
jgi:hypothetical protein